jgi:leucyl-tRNA synthetase
VFTTRPDTLFGVTFVALSPDHPMVDDLGASEWPHDTPQGWRVASSPAEAVRNHRQHRPVGTTDPDTAMNGVFTGRFVRHPATGSQVPVFVADYVLAEAGTGAIMGVPGHDERDWRFARTHGLPIREVITPDPSHEAAEIPYTGEGVVVASSAHGLSIDGLGSAQARQVVIAWPEATGGTT